jgi:hypothetical protein
LFRRSTSFTTTKAKAAIDQGDVSEIDVQEDIEFALIRLAASPSSSDGVAPFKLCLHFERSAAIKSARRASFHRKSSRSFQADRKPRRVARLLPLLSPAAGAGSANGSRKAPFSTTESA